MAILLASFLSQAQGTQLLRTNKSNQKPEIVFVIMPNDLWKFKASMAEQAVV